MIPLRNIRRFFYKAIAQPGYAFSVALKRARAYYAYNFLGGKSFPPEAVTFFLTELCNLRCKMCGQWGDYGASKAHRPERLKQGLSFEDIKKVLDELSAFKPNLTLFGGEPLMHPEIMDIIKYVKSKRLHCLIITNGVTLSAFAEGMVEAGLDELNVSVDGPGQLHDTIRGIPGTFDKIAAGIETLNESKRKSFKKRPLVNLQCTISRYNYERLEEMLEVAERLKANSLTFHNLIFLDQDALERQRKFDALLGCSSKDWEGFVFEPGIEPDKLYQKISEILSRGYPFDLDFFPHFSKKALEGYYQNQEYLPFQYASRCLSPWVCAYIFPDGQVRPCLNSSYWFGNTRQRAFSEIWNSDKAITFRKTLKENKIFPICIRCTELYRY